MVRAHNFIATQITLTRKGSVHTREIVDTPSRPEPEHQLNEEAYFGLTVSSAVGPWSALCRCQSQSVYSVYIYYTEGQTGSELPRSPLLHVLAASSEFRRPIEEIFFPGVK